MNGLHTVGDIAIVAIIVLGAVLTLIGSWGLVRLPTLMERLHGPTKASTLGVGGILIGSVLFFQLRRGEWTAHELLISLFLFIAAPIAANMIAKVHMHRLHHGKERDMAGIAGPPPPLPEGSDWATYKAPGPESPRSISEK